MTDLVPIEILFCKTELPLSTVIMWGLEQPASHVAIDIPSKGLVVQSDLLGLSKAFRAQFLRDHTIVATFKIHCLPTVQTAIEQKFLNFVDTDVGKSGYDFGAFAYFAYRAFLFKTLNRPLPSTNPWGDPQQFLCTEVPYLLNEAVVEVVGKPLFSYDVDLGAVSPWDLRALLIKAAGGNDNEITLPALVPAVG